jgi:hypothetical protein
MSSNPKSLTLEVLQANLRKLAYSLAIVSRYSLEVEDSIDCEVFSNVLLDLANGWSADQLIESMYLPEPTVDDSTAKQIETPLNSTPGQGGPG